MRSRLASLGSLGLFVLALVVAAQGTVFAGTLPVAPEIDASSLSAGLGLLTAGVLIVRARMRSK